ncbi:MAG TPA: nucleotidyl transferase AbiEii/AbiGii toxin family protein [Pseudonocardiaceae bacterium]
MNYTTPAALRTALEHRLRRRSEETGIGLNRLRRRVLLERVVARLSAAEPDRWVLKGGMALEVRLRDAARLTKDIDLGLRGDAADLHERLVTALDKDPCGDGFVITADVPVSLREDGAGCLTWRTKVTAQLDKYFERAQLDVSPRPYELSQTDRLTLPNALDFAGIPAATIEVIDVNRHAAEKLHALCRQYGDRENTRVRDLVDLVLLLEHDQLDMSSVAMSAVQVWRERDDTVPPRALPTLPESWPVLYEARAAEYDLHAQSYDTASALMRRLWADMFPNQEI